MQTRLLLDLRYMLNHEPTLLRKNTQNFNLKKHTFLFPLVIRHCANGQFGPDILRQCSSPIFNLQAILTPTDEGITQPQNVQIHLPSDAVISKKNETLTKLTTHTEIHIFIKITMSYNMWCTWSANFNMCRQLCSFHDGSKRDLISTLKHSFCATKSTYWKKQLFWTQHSSCCCHCFSSALSLQVRQEVLQKNAACLTDNSNLTLTYWKKNTIRQ